MFHRLSSLWRRDTWIRPFLRESKRQVLVSLALGAGAVAFACALMFRLSYIACSRAPRTGRMGAVRSFGVRADIRLGKTRARLFRTSEQP